MINAKDEAQKIRNMSMAGSLKKYYKGKSLKKIFGELQEERRKSDRF